MTTAQILLEDFDVEVSNTRRTLERISADKKDWVPHAKSMPFGRLTMHCATLPTFGYAILADDAMDLSAPKRPWPSLIFTTPEEAVCQLDEAAAQCRKALASASDEALAAKWPFSWGPQVISNVSRSLTYRMMFLNHLVHHTAQLGVYLRLNDLSVPSLYGSSADEQWTPK